MTDKIVERVVHKKLYDILNVMRLNGMEELTMTIPFNNKFSYEKVTFEIRRKVGGRR